MRTFRLQSPLQIQVALHEAGVLEQGIEWHVEFVSVSRERRSVFRRQICRLWAQEQCRYQLYVGPGLRDLYERSRALHSACPEVTNAPAFFFETELAEYVGINFTAGTEADDGLRTGIATPDQFHEAVQILQEALANTEERSSISAAQAELHELETSVLAIDWWSDLDRCVLRDSIFPHLYTALISSAPTRRWSNGDFIARNIILGQDGPKLIDYEFASKTHFFNEDWERLSRYSSLPPKVSTAVKAALGAAEPAVRCFALLRQLTLEDKLKNAHPTTSEIVSLLHDLSQWLDDTSALDCTSRLLVPSAPTAEPPAIIQVFYSSDGMFYEEESQSFPLAPGSWQKLRVPIPTVESPLYLRIDPVDRPGLIDFLSLELALERQGEVLFGSTESTLSGLQIAGTALPLQSGSYWARVLSLGSDPQIILPMQEIRVDTEIVLTLELRWLPPSGMIAELPHGFSEYVPVSRNGAMTEDYPAGENIKLGSEHHDGHSGLTVSESPDHPKQIEALQVLMVRMSRAIARMRKRLAAENQLMLLAIAQKKALSDELEGHRKLTACLRGDLMRERENAGRLVERLQSGLAELEQCRTKSMADNASLLEAQAVLVREASILQSKWYDRGILLDQANLELAALRNNFKVRQHEHAQELAALELERGALMQKIELSENNERSLRAEHNSISALLSELSGKESELRQTLHQTENRVAELQQSLSWKLTAPLRWLAKPFI